MQPPSFQPLLEPWVQSIDNPYRAQEKTLLKLLETYRQTQYNQQFALKHRTGNDLPVTKSGNGQLK